MKLYLIATQSIYFVSLIPWLFFWVLAFILIMHDPTSQNTLYFMIITLYPVAVIICTIIAWYFHINKRSISIAINLIPAIWLIIYSLL
ncbi:hypothetical protein [Ureibacillus acetophenoni]|uniref:Uncharacterized protein n=1 Tax=Ureibacillus acetophenoni TaxID=614649 RepID=A0A285UMY2_9BACL|nr:hypothetical protein [Ureibacillus acetophenoni]SOC43275.1 hypothetical protein SAMN05877842_11559 [Ureibacillus acetophenoni]